MNKKAYVLVDNSAGKDPETIRLMDEQELAEANQQAEDATNGNWWWQEYAPTPPPAQAQVVTFDLDPDGGYGCSHPGDMSGDYTPANAAPQQQADGLVAAINEVLKAGNILSAYTKPTRAASVAESRWEAARNSLRSLLKGE